MVDRFGGMKDLFESSAPREKKPKKKENAKKLRSQIVRCPFCVEGLRLPESEDADTFLNAHFRRCWWLEKNGRGHVGRRADEGPLPLDA